MVTVTLGSQAKPGQSVLVDLLDPSDNVLATATALFETRQARDAVDSLCFTRRHLMRSWPSASSAVTEELPRSRTVL